jgi:hypothetical protein
VRFWVIYICYFFFFFVKEIPFCLVLVLRIEHSSQRVRWQIGGGRGPQRDTCLRSQKDVSLYSPVSVVLFSE